MLISMLLILLSWLIMSNTFSFKMSTQALVTLNLMNVVFMMNLGYFFIKSHTFTYFELVDLSISELLININSNFQLFDSIFYVDNVSNLFMMLTTLLVPFSLLTNWNSIVIFNSKSLFFSLLMWIEMMLIMTFSTVDLFMFYLGFEGLSIPVFFLMYLYGAELTKISASLYFIMYSFSSSTCMAVSIFLLYSQFSTTNINQIMVKYNSSIFSLDSYPQQFMLYVTELIKGVCYKFQLESTLLKPSMWANLSGLQSINMSFESLSLMWILLFLSFIIKLPMVPFHMWSPEAHAEAPTSGSILLTGVILKLGGYGLYSFFMPLFGNFTYFLPLVHMLSIMGIIYIGLTCLKINHIKQIMAYSSIMHMNAVCLGLFTNKIMSFAGAMYAMLSHSLMSSCLFMLAGILYNRYESYYMENYSGLSYNMPYFSFFLIFILFSNMATPLTSGFMAELLILIDLSKYNLFMFFIFFTNYMLNTGYSMWLANSLFFGDIKLNKNNQLVWMNYYDLNIIEITLLSLFSVLIVFFGIFPNTMLPF